MTTEQLQVEQAKKKALRLQKRRKALVDRMRKDVREFNAIVERRHRSAVVDSIAK